MKKIIAGLRPGRRPPWSLVQLAAAFIFVAAYAYAGMGQVLASWQTPASTFNRVNGIAFEGEYIWVKDKVCETGGVVKCTKSGSLIREILFPYSGWNDSYGLAFDGNFLWTIHHEPYIVERYDYYEKYTTNGSWVNGFRAHNYYAYFASNSLSWDGQYLWTDERRNNQSKPDAAKYTTTGTLVAKFAMPVAWKTASGYYNQQLWSGGPNNYIYGMNIGGTLVASFPAPGGSVRAVGFDGNYLWTADANTPQYIYKVDIDVVDVEPGSFGKIKGIYR